MEQSLRLDFNMEMNASNEYVFFVPYKDIDDLTKQVEDIICEIANTADWRNCFIEADTYCDELNLYWRNILKGLSCMNRQLIPHFKIQRKQRSSVWINCP